MLVGPVELLVLSFPQENADPGVIAAVQEVVEAGFVTVLDLVFLSRSSTGEIREIDVSEKLDDVGLGHLEIQEQALISEDDLDLARDILEPGHSAAVIVYENSWARTVGFRGHRRGRRRTDAARKDPARCGRGGAGSGRDGLRSDASVLPAAAAVPRAALSGVERSVP